ncbi:hypothetical protein ACRYJU_11535 [Alloalcanivorax xenomutans]|uniref:hypothetical protein n=1 Tax=Alloalcanivorax xenomutans TaxID=1094342 RepID=UPI003D9B5DE2
MDDFPLMSFLQFGVLPAIILLLMPGRRSFMVAALLSLGLIAWMVIDYWSLPQGPWLGTFSTLLMACVTMILAGMAIKAAWLGWRNRSKDHALDEERRYALCKVGLRAHNVEPQSVQEARAVFSKIRGTARVRYYSTALISFVISFPAMLLIVGFLLLPLSIALVFLGRTEVRRIGRFEERYIREVFEG